MNGYVHALAVVDLAVTLASSVCGLAVGCLLVIAYYEVP